MEEGLFAVAAGCAAFGFALCLAPAGLDVLLRGERVRTSGEATRFGWLAWWVRHGVGPLLGVSGKLARIRVWNRAMRDGTALAVRAGWRTRPLELGSVVLAASVLLLLAVSACTGSLLCGGAVVACSWAVAATWLRSRMEREEQLERSAVPDALRSMQSCFAAGLTLEQTLAQLSSEGERSLRRVFEKAAGVLKTGGTSGEALEVLKESSNAPELAFVAVALDVQHQTGGSIRQVLDAAHDMVKGELELSRSLRVQTAQAKLSARIVTVMPFLLIALFTLISEDFLSPFFESIAGMGMLAMAIGMQASGVLIVRRILRLQE